MAIHFMYICIMRYGMAVYGVKWSDGVRGMMQCVGHGIVSHCATSHLAT